VADMTPKGTVAYVAGVLGMFVGIILAEAVLLYGFALEPRVPSIAPWFLLFGGVIVFAAAHLLAAGLYRMLVHLYHTISRTDPPGDRPMRGQTLYLLGQLGIAMALPTTVIFLMIAGNEPHRPEAAAALVLLGVMPAVFFLMLVILAYFAGLGIMIRDLFIRNRDIVEKRETERRRRLDETEEPQTEVIPIAQQATEEMRQHIKEDR
jgi:hypothetical protein